MSQLTARRCDRRPPTRRHDGQRADRAAMDTRPDRSRGRRPGPHRPRASPRTSSAGVTESNLGERVVARRQLSGRPTLRPPPGPSRRRRGHRRDRHRRGTHPSSPPSTTAPGKRRPRQPRWPPEPNQRRLTPRVIRLPETEPPHEYRALTGWWPRAAGAVLHVAVRRIRGSLLEARGSVGWREHRHRPRHRGCARGASCRRRHVVHGESFEFGAFDFTHKGRRVHGGGDTGVCATGFSFVTDQEGSRLAGPLTSILALRHGVRHPG